MTLKLLNPSQADDAPYIGAPYVTQGHNLAYVVKVEPLESEIHSLFDMASGRASRVKYRVQLATREGVLIDDYERSRGFDLAAERDLAPIGEAEAAELLKSALAKREEQRRERERAQFAAEEKAKAMQAEIARIRPNWAKAALVAVLEQDDCDSMTDYFNATTKKTVLVGWSKHTRDLFPEMRKAARVYPETAHLAEADAEAEHREKYSMGAGYYLKQGSRYCTGWKVEKSCYALDSLGNRIDEIAPALLAPTCNTKGGTFTISEHTHTKKGFQMWICQLGERVERDEFNRLRDAARALGGWYSRPWGGTPGGFAFKDAAKAQQFAEAEG